MAKGRQPLFRRILAGDRLQNAALIKLFHQLPDVRPKANALDPVFRQNAVPDRIVQIPDHQLGAGLALGGLRHFWLHPRLPGHELAQPKQGVDALRFADRLDLDQARRCQIKAPRHLG